jgi:hypothetical protein
MRSQAQTVQCGRCLLRPTGPGLPEPWSDWHERAEHRQAGIAARQRACPGVAETSLPHNAVLFLRAQRWGTPSQQRIASQRHDHKAERCLLRFDYSCWDDPGTASPISACRDTPSPSVHPTRRACLACTCDAMHERAQPGNDAISRACIAEHILDLLRHRWPCIACQPEECAAALWHANRCEAWTSRPGSTMQGPSITGLAEHSADQPASPSIHEPCDPSTGHAWRHWDGTCQPRQAQPSDETRKADHGLPLPCLHRVTFASAARPPLEKHSLPNRANP